MDAMARQPEKMGDLRSAMIVAAALGGLVLKAVGGVQANMLIIAGILLVLGAVCVYFVTDKKQ